MSAATPYPLQWPAGRARRKNSARRKGHFSSNGIHVSVSQAVKRLQDELDRISARYPVISTNVEVRLDGLPRSGQRKPDDPGVAVYFQLQGEPHCLPCDTYDDVAQNIAAVAEHIKATRAIERHGVASVREMFSGFTQIPAQPGQRAWWAVLGLTSNASIDDIEAAFRRLARERHPDHGGTDAQMAELNKARDEARRAKG
jgi:hypothetical protein